MAPGAAHKHKQRGFRALMNAPGFHSSPEDANSGASSPKHTEDETRQDMTGKQDLMLSA